MSYRLPLLTLMAAGIGRRFLQDRNIGIADNEGHRVLEASTDDWFVAERVKMWIDPPIGAGPCVKRAFWSFQPVRFHPREPVFLHDSCA